MDVESFNVVKAARRFGCKAKTVRGIVNFIKNRPRRILNYTRTNRDPVTLSLEVNNTPFEFFDCDYRRKVSLRNRLTWATLEDPQLHDKAFKATNINRRARVYAQPSIFPRDHISLRENHIGYYRGRYRSYIKKEYIGEYYSAVAISFDQKMLLYSSISTNCRIKHIRAPKNAVWRYKEGSVYLLSRDGTEVKIKPTILNTPSISRTYLNRFLQAKRKQNKGEQLCEDTTTP